MANEKRLIDTETVIRKLRKANCAECNVVRKVQCSACWVDDVVSQLEDAPTVDAVEWYEYDAIVEKLENLLCHATGGKFSKAGYSWEDMERMVTDYIEECCQEAVAEETVHAYWIGRQLDNFRKYEVKCSECGWTGIENYDSYVDPSDFNYCPNCGAKMDGGNEDG